LIKLKVSGQRVRLNFKSPEPLLEDGTDKLSRNVRKESQLLAA